MGSSEGKSEKSGALGFRGSTNTQKVGGGFKKNVPVKAIESTKTTNQHNSLRIAGKNPTNDTSAFEDESNDSSKGFIPSKKVIL